MQEVVDALAKGREGSTGSHGPHRVVVVAQRRCANALVSAVLRDLARPDLGPGQVRTAWDGLPNGPDVRHRTHTPAAPEGGETARMQRPERSVALICMSRRPDSVMPATLSA